MYVIGRRHDLKHGEAPQRGEYGKRSDGTWYACAPDGSYLDTRNYNIYEHEGEDTISVGGKIITNSNWKGYLWRGTWRKV